MYNYVQVIKFWMYYFLGVTESSRLPHFVDNLHTDVGEVNVTRRPARRSLPQ
jgi:hypothetical protein